MPNQYEKQNPLTQYPKPPFPEQPQNAPGTIHKMIPAPDHGEETYVGKDRLPGRKALITGGDSGIGRAVAIAFAREGADVAIVYRPEEEGDAQETLGLIEAAGRKGLGLPGDIRDEAFCKELVERAVAGLGGIDVFVSNAGKQTSQKSIADITTEQYDATFKTNVYAPFWITKALLPHLEPGASIIATSSIQASDPSESLLDYAQTKACNVAFVQSLSGQLIQKGIRVNAVAPGPFWTPLQPSGGQPQDVIKEFGKESIYGRPGQPAEIAPVYVFLASQESSYVTGEVYGVTGGAGFK